MSYLIIDRHDEYVASTSHIETAMEIHRRTGNGRVERDSDGALLAVITKSPRVVHDQSYPAPRFPNAFYSSTGL